MLKINALKAASGDFDAKMTVNGSVVKEPNWWLCNSNSTRPIETLPVDCIIHSDASKLSWDADNDLIPTGSHWTNQKDTHVNILE